jgi:hypothetical protein
VGLCRLIDREAGRTVTASDSPQAVTTERV